MINYHLFPLCHLLVTLTNFEEKLRERSAILQGGNMNEEVAKALGTTIVVTEKDRNHIGALLKVSKQISDQMMLEKVTHRIRRFENKLRANISMSDFYAETRILRESFEDDVKSNYLYLYPIDKAKLLLQIREAWAPAIDKFGSIVVDCDAATDCYALGNNIGCVFHCMRILEIGLKTLATDVKLIFDVQQWHTIIDQIESRITAERKTLPKGAQRNARLQFFSEAAKEFFYFKDGWRNYVSHNRADYDEHQAKGVLEHVRAFMNHLATQLSQEPL